MAQLVLLLKTVAKNTIILLALFSYIFLLSV